MKVRAAWDVPVDIDDHDDGTYTCTFVCGNEPEYQGCTVYMVSVMLDGEHVVGSPFAHKVKPLPTDPSKSSVVGFTPLVTAMEPCEFLVQARDEAGRDCLQGMDDMAVAFDGTQGSRDDFVGVDGYQGSEERVVPVRMVSEQEFLPHSHVHHDEPRGHQGFTSTSPSSLLDCSTSGSGVDETRLMDERTATEEFVLHG